MPKITADRTTVPSISLPGHVLSDERLPAAIREALDAHARSVEAVHAAEDRVVEIEQEEQDHKAAVRASVRGEGKVPKPFDKDVHAERVKAAQDEVNRLQRATDPAAREVERAIVEHRATLYPLVVAPLADAYDAAVRAVEAARAADARMRAIAHAASELQGAAILPPYDRGGPGHKEALKRAEALQMALAEHFADANRAVNPPGLGRRISQAWTDVETSVRSFAAMVEAYQTDVLADVDTAAKRGADMANQAERKRRRDESHISMSNL